MTTTANELAAAFAEEAGKELDSAARKIEHCLAQLDESQVWWRPAEEMNSIANLMLHLCGNLRQWIVSGIGGVANDRDRPTEFSERGPLPKSELIDRLNRTVAEAKQALSAASAEELMRQRRIQGFDVSGMQAAFESVAHFRGHSQEIVHLTRAQLGDAYQFDFVPATPEQGAPE